MNKVSILIKLIIANLENCIEASDEAFYDFMKEVELHNFDVTVVDTQSNTQWKEESSYFTGCGAFRAYLGHEVVSHFIFQFDDERIGVYVPRSEEDYSGSDKFYLINSDTFKAKSS